MTKNSDLAWDEQKIVQEIRALGYPISSIAQLRKTVGNYTDAIPILIKGLGSDVSEKTLMEVARALSVPWARPTATAPLIDTFRRLDGSPELGVQWAVGNALAVAWDDAAFDSLVGLAQTEAFGRSREMVVLGLGQSKRTEAVSVLIGLLDDPDVNGHAVKALRKQGVPKSALQPLTRLEGDPRAWVRKEAKRAIESIQKKAQG